MYFVGFYWLGFGLLCLCVCFVLIELCLFGFEFCCYYLGLGDLSFVNFVP